MEIPLPGGDSLIITTQSDIDKQIRAVSMRSKMEGRIEKRGEIIRDVAAALADLDQHAHECLTEWERNVINWRVQVILQALNLQFTNLQIGKIIPFDPESHMVLGNEQLESGAQVEVIRRPISDKGTERVILPALVQEEGIDE